MQQGLSVLFYFMYYKFSLFHLEGRYFYYISMVTYNSEIALPKCLDTFYIARIPNILFPNETDGIPDLHIKVALLHIYDVLLDSIISVLHARTLNTLAHLQSGYSFGPSCHCEMIAFNIKASKKSANSKILTNNPHCCSVPLSVEQRNVECEPKYCSVWQHCPCPVSYRKIKRPFLGRLVEANLRYNA